MPVDLHWDAQHDSTRVNNAWFLWNTGIGCQTVNKLELVKLNQHGNAKDVLLSREVTSVCTVEWANFK